jgi:hypothetical protein
MHAGSGVIWGIPADSLIDGRALVNWGSFRGVLICAICGASLLG